MSSIINMDMALISTSNIIPEEQQKKIFEDCVNELGGILQNNILLFDGENIGKIIINNRIVLSFSSDYNTSKRDKVRTLLRDTFTRRVSIAHENYIYELKKEKERIEKQNRAEAELLNSLKDIETKIMKSEIGFQRQHQSECEALKGEIIDAAISQGYEVVEEQNNNGVQLQFVRRDYQC